MLETPGCSAPGRLALPNPATEVTCIVLLLAVLGFAVARPRGLPEVVAAAPAAGLVVAVGALPWSAAADELRALLPVVAFLAAVLVLADVCDEEGLFTAAGAFLAQASGGHPRRLLALVFLVASAVTAVLGLDATVVLLTPVIVVTALGLRVRARPHVYACAHLANTASLLLPVSNLTNLLALTSSGLSFAGFAARMALPWAAAIGLEYLAFRRFFRNDLQDRVPVPAGARATVPVVPLVVLAGVLAGFVVSSPLGIDPAWVAATGAVVLAGRGLARGRLTVSRVVRAASMDLCVFVLALGVVIRAVQAGGVGRLVRTLVPAGASLPTLFAVAGLAALLANLLNNVPAALLLLPIAAGGGAGPVLATLVGVNIGPNATYTGSL
ncbi:MAG: SLC13 family permease, partial [Frankiaceae bacterium]